MNFIGFLLKKRIKYKILCFVYRLSIDLPVPIYLSVPFFRYQQLDQYDLRNSRERKLTVRITNNTYGKRCFWVSGAESWNSLPCDLILSPSYDTFEARLKTPILNALSVKKMSFKTSTSYNFKAPFVRACLAPNKKSSVARTIIFTESLLECQFLITSAVCDLIVTAH